MHKYKTHIRKIDILHLFVWRDMFKKRVSQGIKWV